MKLVRATYWVNLEALLLHTVSSPSSAGFDIDDGANETFTNALMETR